MSTPEDEDLVSELVRLLRRAGELRTEQGGELAALLDEHLGRPAAECTIVTDGVAPWRLVDADTALRTLDPHARLVGVTVPRGFDGDLRGLLLSRRPGITVGPVDHTTVPVGPGLERRVMSSGVRLMTYEGRPVAVLQRAADPDWGRRATTLEVVGTDPDLVDAFRADVRRLMVEHSVLRGQVMSFSGGGFDENLGGLVFVEPPRVAEADVVLPDGVLDRLHRHVGGVGEHRARLLAAGQHLKRGILLHGPPGTGKTHTVRHLVGRTDGVTVFLLSGASMRWVREASRLARALEPAMIVLEDCDLIAEDRGMGGGGELLFELLEALDGMDGDADVAFVLTTNRPDLLERALTRRPGRIDLAVEVPLPDEAARARLFGLYAAGLGLSDAVLADAAARAEGVTASFAKELVRRAVLVAAVAGEELADVHLTTALDELLDDREALTRSLLGSGQRATEDQGDLEPAGRAYLAYVDDEEDEGGASWSMRWE
ncbi:ATP-binding protein [Nocardioides sp. CFH 31398]|uniref:AAA family ATPase n=1 Tax=Nocardioides sp. CFH 31398 TaxID=2919579 RepID=UPI001F0578FC|nr:ATP-binding protein [Nocardioides sp. CFH 31398]MCH1866961.1 ATP-binding protein [Nocardioides sp. CFH 31398]